MNSSQEPQAATASSRTARYCRFVSRRAGTILLSILLLLIGSGFLASKLELKTALSELLPSNDPGVIALEATQKRLGDMSLLLVGVRSPDREANLRYADMLTEKLRALPKSVLSLAAYNIRDLKSFFESNKWLYVSEKDLTDIRDRLRSEISKRKNPLLVDLGDDDDEESVESMRQRLTKEDPLGGRFPDGVFSNQDGTYVWIAALPPGGIFGERGGEGLFQAANRLIKENDPHAFNPQMTAYVGGPVATGIATREAVERDILWVTITCLSIVALSIGVYFRRLRSLPLIATSGVVGTVMAFAVAELAFGYVNSSTAFLGSIILGNGINYAIILMSRYEEYRASGESTVVAMEHAIAGVVRGTGVAAICASAAYATLMLTKFRGFYQFGVMAAFGVLFCWALTFTILPAIFFLMARWAPAGKHDSPRAPLNLSFLGRLLAHRPGTIALVASVLTVSCCVGMLHFAGAPFEYDFRKLYSNLKSTNEAQEFSQSADNLFGRWPSPTIVLADSRKETEYIRAAIWRQNKADPVIGQVVTIDDVLPGTPESQTKKLALLKDIRKLTHDPALETLNEKERKQVAAIDIPETLQVLAPDALPPLARRPFTEGDGTVGRVVLVYPVEEHLSVWNGLDLLRIANVIQYLHLPEENKTLATSGSAVVFAAMIRSILHDGPLVTAASLIVVLAFSLLIMRPWSAAFAAIGTLLVGVVWMMGIAGAAEVRITFLNFIALPITFGIGAEYGLNVAQRYRDDKDMIRAVTSTGAAVALCSWTTIVGYGSLLAASSRALRGFGLMAILGEISCLAAALLVLPSIILWRKRRRQRSAIVTKTP
jgi:predicted RND superfamily exporter protein